MTLSLSPSNSTPTSSAAPATPAAPATSSRREVMLLARGISKTYRDGDRILEVLRGVDLTVHRGEAVAIIGSSGAGKSTLLHILGALDRPTHGEITLDGQMYSRQGDKQLAALRARHVGFIYQFHHLLPEFSALENVLVPGLILEMRYGEMIERASRLLRAVGLGERLDHRPARLSGGEQQRVALARALMNNPSLVLADEPTGDLDHETGQAVIDLIWKETVGCERSFIIVTHDPQIARRANRIYCLENGRLRPERSR